MRGRLSHRLWPGNAENEERNAAPDISALAQVKGMHPKQIFFQRSAMRQGLAGGVSLIAPSVLRCFEREEPGIFITNELVSIQGWHGDRGGNWVTYQMAPKGQAAVQPRKFLAKTPGFYIHAPRGGDARHIGDSTGSFVDSTR